jgi:2-keto-4-pentenoate hydratase/2-oxohepta-3-ene-1,7-dioic acid hydratase in catechol pathway
LAKDAIFATMKFICIGRNYADHAKELKNDVPAEPVIFLKPDTAHLRNNLPFYIPAFSNDVHHELELVVRIDKHGKKIEERFAHKYYNELTVGVDFTARDKQSELKSKGLPWELAKAFDTSAAVGKMVDKTKFTNLQNLNIHLLKNEEKVQVGNTGDMLFGIDKIIHFVSQYITLKKGDFIFTGTPAGVGKVEIGDHLQGFLEDEKLFDFRVK